MDTRSPALRLARPDRTALHPLHGTVTDTFPQTPRGTTGDHEYGIGTVLHVSRRNPLPHPSNALEAAYLADHLANRERRAHEADHHAQVNPDPVVWCDLHDEAIGDCTGCEKQHQLYGVPLWGGR